MEAKDYLGRKVHDSISGLDGVVIAVTIWMYGCTRLIIQPEGFKDGKPYDSFIVDEPQCVLLEAAAPATPDSKRHGGRNDAVARMH